MDTPAPAIRERREQLIKLIASTVGARRRCQETSNTEWYHRHSETLRLIEREILPSGSGLDSGTKIDADASTRNRIVLWTAYHHMNDGGMYDGWTEHTITIRPDLLSGFTLSISGRNRNDIKEYLYQTFEYCLSADVIHAYDPTHETETIRFAPEVPHAR
jgi:hypothetical protein